LPSTNKMTLIINYINNIKITCKLYNYYYEVHLYLCSTKSHNAANALNRQSHCKQKCIQFMSESFDWNVWGSKVSRKTVPCPRSLHSETAVAVIRLACCVWGTSSCLVKMIVSGKCEVIIEKVTVKATLESLKRTGQTVSRGRLRDCWKTGW